MTESRGTSSTMILGMVISAVIGVGGVIYGVTGREIAYKVDVGLAQDMRIRSLEQKSAARDEQYKAISDQLTEIKALIKEKR